MKSLIKVQVNLLSITHIRSLHILILKKSLTFVQIVVKNSAKLAKRIDLKRYDTPIIHSTSVCLAITEALSNNPKLLPRPEQKCQKIKHAQCLLLHRIVFTQKISQHIVCKFGDSSHRLFIC